MSRVVLIDFSKEHEFEWVVKPRTFKWKGKQSTYSFNLYVPMGDGVNHTNFLRTKSDSYGLSSGSFV